MKRAGASRLLAERLRERLAAGEYRAGERLPSIRNLTEQFQLGFGTVTRAMNILANDGWVDVRHGSGSYARDRRGEERDASSNSQRHALMRRDASVLAILLSNPRMAGFPLLEGFEEACRTEHRQMLLCNTNNDLDLQSTLILQLIRGDHIGGVAMRPVSSPPTPTYQALTLQEHGIPVVFLSRGIDGIRAPVVAVLYEEYGPLVGRAMLEYGHRRVAFLASVSGRAVDIQLRCFRETMQDGGGDLPDEFVFVNQMPIDPATHEKDIHQAIHRMLDTENRPTGIWVTTGQDAEFVYSVLRRAGLRVPEDISLLSTCGDVNPGSGFFRRCSRIIMDEADMGRRAVKLLREMQAGERALDDNERIVLPPPELCDGETLGAAPRAAFGKTRIDNAKGAKKMLRSTLIQG